MSQKITKSPQARKYILIENQRLRVAAYCRVSTRHEEQCHSLEAQIAYYTDYIKRNPNWKFVAVYSDIASGIRAANRPGYKQLLKDCAKGKIDLILVKSLSRFGRDMLNHTQFLGYTKGPDGVLQIVPEEAEIVRKIFDLYVQGNGVRKIKRYLEKHGIKTVTGKSEWSTSTIDRMLSNEKYIGEVRMQKTFTADFLTGRREKNIGQLDSYLVENAHEPIIGREIFELVQRMKRNIKSKQMS